ncbi:hypothetical protein GCM10010174_03290 [Kutzneria viridogrisea]|uniref:Holin n=1 Tax=Kutzneria viridogrisea TaxID=47990 RepID=A0ABR6BRC6_9PSEU|nr:hypothetical protein [Kutzneria viridogrisea]
MPDTRSRLRSRHPAMAGGSVCALAAAVITLASSYGVPVTQDQHDALMTLVAILAPLAVGWWSSHRTTPHSDPRTRGGQRLVPHVPAVPTEPVPTGPATPDTSSGPAPTPPPAT